MWLSVSVIWSLWRTSLFHVSKERQERRRKWISTINILYFIITQIVQLQLALRSARPPVNGVPHRATKRINAWRLEPVASQRVCIRLSSVWRTHRAAELWDVCAKWTLVVLIWSALIPTSVSWHESEQLLFIINLFLTRITFTNSSFNLTSALYAETDIYSEVVVLVKATSTVERFENLKGTKACIAEFGGIGWI